MPSASQLYRHQNYWVLASLATVTETQAQGHVNTAATISTQLDHAYSDNSDRPQNSREFRDSGQISKPERRQYSGHHHLKTGSIGRIMMVAGSKLP